MTRSRFRRPESVLIVIHTAAGEALILRRRAPHDYWQSVTGSLRWNESQRGATLRELREETGLDGSELLEDCGVSNRYAIAPAWQDRFAPNVHQNVEHVWRARLPAPVSIVVNPREHFAYEWLPIVAAAERVASSTDRAALLGLL